MRWFGFPEKSNLLAPGLFRTIGFLVTLAEYLRFFQILLAIGMGVVLGGKPPFRTSHRGKIKDSPYECGLAADTKGETRYSVKFYVRPCSSSFLT